MYHSSIGEEFAGRVVGPIYAFLYFTNQYRFLGFTIGGWLKTLPFFFSILALLLGWPFFWFVFGIILAILVRVLYWKAKRDGFIIFLVENDQLDTPEPISENQKLGLRATGTFSVKDWEDYLVRQPAEYWRVPVGDHAIMVERSKGQFLYQFIQPELVEQIDTGRLCFGTYNEPALSITFFSTWGPESEEVSFMFYSPDKNNNKSPRLKRKIVLSFQTREQKYMVWSSLLSDNSQSVDEKR